MSTAQATSTGTTSGDRSAPLVKFLNDLLTTLQLQAKETERLVAHLEQHTHPLQPASQFPLVVTELSHLRARLHQIDAPCSAR